MKKNGNAIDEPRNDTKCSFGTICLGFYAKHSYEEMPLRKLVIEQIQE